MTDTHWSRVTDLVGRALERPDTERLGWLEAEAAGDARLVAEVTRLLEADSLAGGFLEQPLVAEPAVAEALRRALCRLSLSWRGVRGALR